MTLNRRSFLLGSGLNAFSLAAAIQLIQPPKAAAASSPLNESVRTCRPKDSLTALMNGNERFATAWQAKNKASNMNERSQRMANLWLDNCFLPSQLLQDEQSPWASIISCADSRVSPEWIFDATAGDLFVIRSAGNTPFTEGIASLEYSVEILKTPLIMVLGHSNCGAVQAALSNDPLTPLFEQLVNPIRASLTPGETLENSIKVNASATSRQLTSRSDVLANAVKDGTLQIVVGYFDIGSGKVSLI